MPLPLEQFLKQLEESGLIAGDTLKEFLPPNATPQDTDELACELIRKKKLTQFQVEEISNGTGRSLILGNYVLLEKIGAGGMGQVFKARHSRMDRHVAVKLLPTATSKDTMAIARFEREVKAAAKINHPNIVAAHDADCANGIHFLVMELVNGSDLSALVKKNGPFSIEKTVNYILQAAKGLEAAHKKGIIHRDIKPSNLLLDAEGNIKVLDLGLARLSWDEVESGLAELTSTGTVMGTVDYMPPEQALDTKNADARADIYALGCSMFYLLTGKPTYQGDTLMMKLLAHRDNPIPSLTATRPEVPDQLDSIFKKLVAKKVEDRYQTMTTVVDALETISGSRTKQLNIEQLDTSITDAASCIQTRPTFDNSATVISALPIIRPNSQANGSSLKWRKAVLRLLAAVVVLCGILLVIQSRQRPLLQQPDHSLPELKATGNAADLFDGQSLSHWSVRSGNWQTANDDEGATVLVASQGEVERKISRDASGRPFQANFFRLRFNCRLQYADSIEISFGVSSPGSDAEVCSILRVEQQRLSLSRRVATRPAELLKPAVSINIDRDHYHEVRIERQFPDWRAYFDDRLIGTIPLSAQEAPLFRLAVDSKSETHPAQFVDFVVEELQTPAAIPKEREASSASTPR